MVSYFVEEWNTGRPHWFNRLDEARRFAIHELRSAWAYVKRPSDWEEVGGSVINVFKATSKQSGYDDVGAVFVSDRTNKMYWTAYDGFAYPIGLDNGLSSQKIPLNRLL